MLATHVINGNRQPSLSRAHFAQLLQESLGTDEHGQPNLGEDVSVNLKLISVVVHIGIEPLLLTTEVDPFRERLDQGKKLSELKCCLDVIHLAIQRNVEVIFKPADLPADPETTFFPVYAWLLPTLLLVHAQCSDPEITNRCGDILQLFLSADARCICGTCGSVLDLLNDVTSGTYADSLLHKPTNGGSICQTDRFR